MMPCRDGIGLPAILAVLAVSAVASLGIVAVGLRRGLDAQDAAQWVRTGAAAESAVRIALAHWNADSARATLPGASWSVPSAGGTTIDGVTHSATLERIDAELFVVRAEAVIDRGGSPGAQAAALAAVRMLSTDEIWRDFYAAIGSGGAVHLANGALVSGTDAGVPAAWRPSDCPAGLAATVAALLGGPDRPGLAMAAGAPVTGGGATVTGLPPILAGAPRTGTADFRRLGALPLSDVAIAADRVEFGSVHLAPASAGGVCSRRSPGNWGSPGSPSDPCFDFIPLIHAPAGLEVASGTGQGILVVEGDLTLGPGVSFTGLVLTTGGMRMNGAHVTGAVRAGSGARIDGVVTYSGCAVGRILERARALRKPYRLGARLWLPAF